MSTMQNLTTTKKRDYC